MQHALSQLSQRVTRLSSLQDEAQVEVLKEELGLRNAIIAKTRESEQLLKTELARLVEVTTNQAAVWQEVAQAKQQLAEKESTLQQLETEISHLRGSSKSKDYFELAADYEMKISSLEKKETRLQQQLAEAEQALERLREKHSDAKLQLDSMLKANQELKKAKEASDHSVVQLKAELKLSSNTIHSLHSRVDTAKSESLETEVSELSKSCMKLEVAYSEMHDKYLHEQQACSQLRKELETQGKLVEALQSQLAQVEHSHQSLQTELAAKRRSPYW